MVTISDKGSVEELNKPLEHSQDIPAEKQEESDQETNPTQREELREKEILNPYAPFSP